MTAVQTMAELPVGGAARVVSLCGAGPLQQRLADLGLIEGTRVECLLRRRGIAAYLIRGAVIAVRAADCTGVLLEAAP